MTSVFYGYGIIDAAAKVDNIHSFEDKALETIPYKSIALVVSPVSSSKFSQETVDANSKNMKWIAENAQIHDDVVHKILEKTTIIPMKFCTIFSSKKKAEEMLHEKYAACASNLKNLQNKVEVGIKVYVQDASLKSELAASDTKIRQLTQEAKEKTPGAAYFVEQKKETLLQSLVDEHLSKEKTSLFSALSKKAIDSKQNQLLSKKLTGKKMLLNAVFLIAKADVPSFLQSSKKLASKYDAELYGPFAPYNFVK